MVGATLTGGGGGKEVQEEFRGVTNLCGQSGGTVGHGTGACGVREVDAESNDDSIREPNGSQMLPEELRPAPSFS